MKTQISKWLIIIATFVSLMFVVSGLEAGKPDKLDNPNKPPKSDQPAAECIVFTGDLMGEAVVEGCCPNAGPFPEYEMTLDLKDEDRTTTVHHEEYDGELFTNNWGAGRNHGYQVQFWTWDWNNENPVVGDICIEVIGGIIDNDKKNKILTVTFVAEDCVDRESNQFIDAVTFTLVRTRL